MSATANEPTMKERVVRLAEVVKELAALRVEQSTAGEQAGASRQRIHPQSPGEMQREKATGEGRSRRVLLRKSRFMIQTTERVAPFGCSSEDKSDSQVIYPVQ